MKTELTNRLSDHYFSISLFFLNKEKPFSARLADCVNYISTTFGIKRLSIMLIDYNEMAIEVAASTNPKIVGLKRKLSDVSISTMALIENEALWIDNESRSYFQSLDSSKYESTASLSLPIRYFDKKLGVINLTDFRDIKVFVEHDMELLKELVKMLSPIIYAEIANESCSDYARKLEQKHNQMIELDRLKTELINFIVHDLKGPISVVIANLDMLLYDNLTESQLELVTLAYEETEKLQRMVLNILDVHKLEEAKISILREETDLYELARLQVRSLGGLLKRRRIEVTLEGSQTPCYIDAELIGRTITNILLNAIEHSPDDSKVTVRVFRDNDENVCVSVEDMGGGIPEEMLDKIFDKYFQALEEGRAYSKTSTGLGLTFCKLVVDAHGGTIKAQNTGRGALFTIILPQNISVVKQG